MNAALDEELMPFAEPFIPLSTEVTDVQQVRSIIAQLDTGVFRVPALLVERMLMNPRLRAVVETRLGGLISTEIEWQPSKENRDGRRAAREFAEDWPLIAPAPMRKQMAKWGLFLGFALGQRDWSLSPATKRLVPKLRPYWPGFAYWYWAQQSYRIFTWTKGMKMVGSPAIDRRIVEQVAFSYGVAQSVDASSSPWVISEPFGVNSYREGLVHAAWRPWLGHDWAMRDQARASEKHGVGVMKFLMPRGTGDQWKAANARFITAARSMGSEGVIPLEQDDEGRKQDVEAFEFNGQGFQAISDTMNANAVALAILFLGHNLTTEIKGGSYAAAGVADYIRDDKKHEDGEIEWAYAGPQLAEAWALENYGDASLAPKAKYVTDSLTINLQRAQMANFVAMATSYLRANVPEADLPGLLDQFRIPLRPEGATVAMPAALPGQNADGTLEDKTPPMAPPQEAP